MSERNYDSLSLEEFKEVAQTRRNTPGLRLGDPSLTCRTVPLTTFDDVRQALEAVGEYNNFDPGYAIEGLETYEQEWSTVIVGFDSSPVIYVTMLQPIEVVFYRSSYISKLVYWFVQDASDVSRETQWSFRAFWD